MIDLLNFYKQIKRSPVELFGVIFFKENGIAGTRILGKGTSRGVTFNVGEVVNAAKELGAKGMTLVHNHPSGVLRPSELDLETTYTLHDKCKPQGLLVIDHIIVGQSGYFSFKANGITL